MTQPDHHWRGGHRVRVARADGAVVIQLALLATRTGKVSSRMGDVFRRDFPELRAVPHPLAVEMWALATDPHRRIDLDNLAKAVLDALKGIVWQDDSQIQRLTMVKLAAESDRLILRVRPVALADSDPSLDALLATIDALPKRRA